MRINPSLLLLLLFCFIFEPSVREWATESAGTWYRIYFVWVIIIGFVYYSQRGSSHS